MIYNNFALQYLVTRLNENAFFFLLKVVFLIIESKYYSQRQNGLRFYAFNFSATIETDLLRGLFHPQYFENV